MSRPVYIAVLIAAGLPLLAACIGRTSAAPATLPPGGDVYFIGVDHAPAGPEGVRVARLFGVGEDRWSLSETVRAIARRQPGLGIGLDAPIDRWNPVEDPYNFGVITLRGASHRTMNWPGVGSRTHVTVDLIWLQIGHDSRTRMQQEKLPELRFTVTRPYVLERNSAQPLDAAGLDDLYREAFTQAAGELLRLAKRGQERDLRRSATGIRYLQIKSPALLPEAERLLGDTAPRDGGLSPDRVSAVMGAQLESGLLEQFASDAALDDYVLLPSALTVDYLESEWGVFAQRVAALSTYNAAREAMGFRPPRLLRPVPLCTAAGEHEVHALEVRSNLAALRFATDPENDHVEGLTLSAFLAADTKLPLDASRSVRLDDPDQLPAQASAVSRRVLKPRHIPSAEFFGPHAIQIGVEAAAQKLSPTVAGQLRRLLKTPPLSHPSYLQRFCS